MTTDKNAVDDSQHLMVQDPRQLQAYYQEDEISLVDLWLVLVKHKRVMAAIFFTIAILGLVYALLIPRVYTYATSIEIARSEDKLLDSPDTVLAKLQESYIPFVLKENESADGDRLKISAKIPKKSDLIVLESKAPEGADQRVQALHQEVVQLIAADHGSTISAARAELQAQLHSANNKLAELKDREKLIQNKEQRLDEKAGLLTTQIEAIRKVIKESRTNRQKAISEVSGEAKAMTLLLIDNEIQQYQEREAQLAEQLHIGLANERDSLFQELANLRRAQDEQEEKLQEVKAKIANIRETRAITPTMRSLEPTGTGRKMILVLAIVLGGLLAVFGAFFSEFMEKVRQRKMEGGKTENGITPVL
ncbi:MAG: Wzz/FepE/Etk N-terminal domain-containing protein [Gammaproteobacteria bacterium]